MFVFIYYSSDSPDVVAVGKKIKSVAIDYSKAIDASVVTAVYGIAFAEDVVGLCEYLTQKPHTDVRQYIEEMRQIARKAHGDAKDTYEKFRAVRRTILQVCILATICLESLVEMTDRW
jgi:hypothetical protein